MWTPCCIESFIYLSVWDAKFIPNLLSWRSHGDWVHHIASYPISATEVIVLLYDEGPNSSLCKVSASRKACRTSTNDNNIRICILFHRLVKHFRNSSCDLFFIHIGKYLCHIRDHAL